MWFILSLLACNNIDAGLNAERGHHSNPVAKTATREPTSTTAVVELPAGQAVFRAECIDGEREETGHSRSNRKSTGSVGGGGGSASPSAPSLQGPTPKSAKAAKRETPRQVQAAPEQEARPDPAPSMDRADEVATRDVSSQQPAKPVRPDLDWGATVYLSNDDSMSLASAQRVLWSASQGLTVPVSQIRPHELLNYFTFDTAEVSSDHLFSVQGSAVPTGDDTLSVALAVRGANPPRVPLDLTLVIDRSGSMAAEGRMAYTKRAMTLMSNQLQRGDRVDVVLFDHQVCTALEDYVVGRDDAALLTRAIDGMAPRGSTNLDAGLKEGYRLATAREGGIARNQRVMLFTDAWLNTGDVNPNTVSEVGKAYEDKGIRLTGVGVGKKFNDSILDMLTEKGKGAYVYLGTEAVVDRLFGHGFDSLTRTIAHNVHFSIDLPSSLAMERFYGEESSTTKADVQPINYYAGTTQVFLQDLRMRSGGASAKDKITLTVQYRDAATEEPVVEKHILVLDMLKMAPPHNLHKARALMAWTDLLMARAMGADACADPLVTYQQRAGLVSEDAEIGYVNTLVKKTCPAFDLTSAPETVTYKVKLDSDIPIAEVKLSCGGRILKESLSASDTVARFDTQPGECSLVLGGMVPMEVAVNVPETGGTVRCIVRGGRVQCSS